VSELILFQLKAVYKLMRRNDSVFARAGGVWAFQYKDSVGGGGGSSNKVDTIYRTPGKDSIQFTIDGRYHAIKDSSGGGSSDITVGTTVVNSGTNKKFAYNAAGVYGESAMLSQETNQILVSAPAGSTTTPFYVNDSEDNTGYSAEFGKAGIRKIGLGTDGFLESVDISAPSTPSSGYGRMYVRADSLRFKNDAGTEFTLGISGGGGSGVTTVGSFSGSSQTNGASISGSTITFGPADGTNPGMVSTGTQTFAGVKTFTSSPTSPGVGSGSERFGSGATAGGANGVAIGNGASAGGSNSAALGQNASAAGASSFALGSASSASQSSATAIGVSATASGINSTSIGSSSTASGTYALAIGQSTSAGHTGSIAIGQSSASTATGQLVIGSSPAPIANVFFDKGVTDASPGGVTINASGGSGTNIAGGTLTLAGGKATGNAAGGNINFQTSTVGSSGTTLQTLATRLTISPNSATYATRVLQAQGADVASANNLSLGVDGNTFEITGTTQINLISNTNWQNGSEVTLLLASGITIKHGQATSGSNITISLSGAADLVTTSETSLTLVLSEVGGTQKWRQKGAAISY